MQPTFSTGTQYTQTATPATTEGKQYPTCYQQQSTGPRWKRASFRPSGLAKTPQQMRTFSESAKRLSKQGQSCRRQTKPEKYNKQMMDIIDSTPMTTPTPTSFVVLPARLAVSNKQETSTAEPQTQQAPELPILRSSQQTSTPTITDVPMATSPTTYNRRTPLPIPTTAKREWQMTSQKAFQQSNHGRDNNRRQRRGRKQHKNQTRPDSETVATKLGDKVKAVSNENQQEAETEKILLEPWVTNTEGLNPEQTTEGMKQEIRSMKAQQVYTEVSYKTLTREQRNKIIKSRWVLRQKGNAARARIVAKGYTEDVKDNDDIYASTPIFCVLRQ